VALRYVEQKINEVRNLRMILRGRVQGMEPEQIMRWVII
jgi:vacuolar-type H+-ATPase subunit C/Vma6